MKYKYMLRGKPGVKDSPKKWHANPMPDSPEDVKSMTRAATENTTTSAMEMETALSLWGSYAAKRLLAGESVRVGDLGTLRITFRSKGVENIDDFKASQMIYDVRLRFTPSKEFRENVVNKMTFECGGVLEDGIDYSSVLAYKKAKGLLPVEPVEPGTGGGGGSGETPLG